jgi:hypothetical protein
MEEDEEDEDDSDWDLVESMSKASVDDFSYDSTRHSNGSSYSSATSRDPSNSGFAQGFVFIPQNFCGILMNELRSIVLIQRYHNLRNCTETTFIALSRP